MIYSFDRLFDTAKELIEFFIADERFSTKSKLDTHYVGRGAYIFRGQSNANWKLKANCFRSSSKLENYALQPPNNYSENESPTRRLGRHLVAETQAVRAFLEAADSQGINTPISYESATEWLDKINKLLSSESDIANLDVFPEETLYRAFALAQHYGVPTRFLDWTESPLTACFFAAYNASMFAKEPAQADQEISVTFINTKSFYCGHSPVTLVQAPRCENSNLLQQKGVFTLINNCNSFFLDNDRWPNLEDFADNSSEFIKQGYIELDRVRLPAHQSNALLRILYDLGVSKLSLMPSLYNAATAMDYKKRLFEND